MAGQKRKECSGGMEKALSSEESHLFVKEVARVPSHVFAELGVEVGPCSDIVVAEFDGYKHPNRQMIVCCALKEVFKDGLSLKDFRLPHDHDKNFVYVLCPSEAVRKKLRGSYIQVGSDYLKFYIVKSLAARAAVSDDFKNLSVYIANL